MATNFPERVDIVVTSASTVQTLHEQADMVIGADLIAGGATSIDVKAYTVVSTTATSAALAFAGKPGTPSDSLTFNAALAANGLLAVRYVPAGHIPVPPIPPQG
jgi:hypothetical protein